MPTCLGDSIEAPVSLLLSNNKSLLQSTSFNWTFFLSSRSISTFVTCVKCCPQFPPCSLIVSPSETAENDSLLIRYGSSARRWVPAFWCGTPSEFPFSPPRLHQYVLKQIYAPISCLALVSRHGCFAISRWFGRYGSVTLLCSFSRTGGDRNLPASPPHSLPLPLG